MINDAVLAQIRNLIAGRIGLLVREQDDEMLRRVISERVKALKMSGAEQYCRFLETDAGIRHEREELAKPFTTGETYFFRDAGLHRLLRNEILPELLERGKPARVLRIWCAACASGEEAYSLAIVLDELLADQSQWSILILGTDINRHAIEKARRGVYSEWSFRGMSPELRQRYFQRHKDGWGLDERIRSKVTFQTNDLVGDAFPDHTARLYDMDLILCRNAFIYMPANTVFHIVDKFAETLKEEGMLIVGHGELYAHHLGKLRARVFDEAIVYQRISAAFYPAGLQNQTDIPEIKAALHNARAASVVPATQPARQEASASKIQQAWQLANLGQREAAAKLCGEMTAQNPLDAEPYYLMALLAQERGDFAAAREMLKKVIYLDPSFIAAYLDLGDFYAREGEGARAEKMRSTARDLLRNQPGCDQVKYYGASTVNAVLQYVEHLLSMQRDAGR